MFAINNQPAVLQSANELHFFFVLAFFLFWHFFVLDFFFCIQPQIAYQKSQNVLSTFCIKLAGIRPN